MIKEFKTGKAEGLFVEVPEDAKGFELVSSLRNPKIGIDCFNSTLLYTFSKDHQGHCHIDGLGIHSESHPVVLFDTKSATQEDAKKIVDISDYDSIISSIFHLHKLMQSLNLDTSKNYAVLIKVKS